MKKIGAVLFFAAITVLAFWKVIFHGEFTLLAGGDTSSAYFPWFDVAAYWLKKGVFLLWDPYVYAGKFNMGEPQPGLFYPLNWVVMLLPSAAGGVNLDALQGLFIFDYFLAALFLYLLARSMSLSVPGFAIAAIAFAFGGLMAQFYGYANILSGFVWLPVVFYAFRKALLAERSNKRIGYLIGGGVALALSFLPGHHIPPVHAGLLIFLYAAFRMAIQWKEQGWTQRAAAVIALGSIALIAVLLTAFQWVPSAEWARHVYRWIGMAEPIKWGQPAPYSALQGASPLSPQDALSLLLPYVSTNASFYTGGVVLFLALVGFLFVRRTDSLFCAAGALIYFFLSWGRLSVTHGWLNTFVPGVWFAASARQSKAVPVTRFVC